MSCNSQPLPPSPLVADHVDKGTELERKLTKVWKLQQGDGDAQCWNGLVLTFFRSGNKNQVARGHVEVKQDDIQFDNNKL